MQRITSAADIDMAKIVQRTIQQCGRTREIDDPVIFYAAIDRGAAQGQVRARIDPYQAVIRYIDRNIERTAG